MYNVKPSDPPTIINNLANLKQMISESANNPKTRKSNENSRYSSKNAENYSVNVKIPNEDEEANGCTIERGWSVSKYSMSPI